MENVFALTLELMHSCLVCLLFVPTLHFYLSPLCTILTPPLYTHLLSGLLNAEVTFRIQEVEHMHLFISMYLFTFQ